LAQKRKKAVKKSPAPATRKARKVVKPSPVTRRSAIKKAPVNKRLITKAVKTIKSRSQKHSDQWIKDHPKTPPPSPVKKKSSKKPAKPVRKLAPIKLKGKKISPELEAKIRKLRAEYVKQGKFLTNKEILKRYLQVEQELLHNKPVNDNDDPLKLKGKVQQGLSVEAYPLNGVVNQLFNFRQEFGKFSINVTGFGESNIDKYSSFGEGLRRVDQELGIIWTAFDVYKIEYTLNSPYFEVIMAWDSAARIAYIDFNLTIFRSVDIDKLIRIIYEIKNNLHSGFDSQLSKEEMEELEQVDILEAKEQEKQQKEKTKKKSAKKMPSKTAKKSPVKKSAKKKIKYPVRSNGEYDMRYKVNRDLAARKEKVRKTRERNKRAAQKAERERIKKYQIAAAKRKATIAANKKALIKQQAVAAAKRAGSRAYKTTGKKKK